MLSQQLEYSVSVCGMHLELQRREERVFASALVIYNYIIHVQGQRDENFKVCRRFILQTKKKLRTSKRLAMKTKAQEKIVKNDFKN
jgi:hypothetical protein